MSDQKRFVERIFRRYAKKELLPSDPVGLVHDFQNPQDRETAALLCALFAYGGVKAMRSFLSTLLRFLNPDRSGPAAGLRALKNQKIRSEMYYRFQSKEDIGNFLIAASNLMTENAGPIWESYLGKP